MTALARPTSPPRRHTAPSAAARETNHAIGMGEPEDRVEDSDEWSIDAVLGELCLDALKDIKVVSPFPAKRGNEPLRDRDALVHSRTGRQG